MPAGCGVQGPPGDSRHGGAGRSKQRGSRSTAAQKQRRPGTKYRPRKAPPTDRARLKVNQTHAAGRYAVDGRTVWQPWPIVAVCRTEPGHERDDAAPDEAENQ